MSEGDGMGPIKTLQTGYIVRLLYFAIGALVFVHMFGTIGYMVLTEHKYSWFDCFYMTFITVATIGFGEIIDMSSNQPARILTVIIGIL
ncbi:MAG: potassium channel protein, partial [Betaproteobacteria bacterium]|nr:potassium channel protein [Betaproteobacteria bacterium]